MSTMQQKYLVTPALPYANGHIHLGHLLEHIQVNIFVRSLRMAGKDVLYICGADSHGTPIEMSAKKAGIAPEIFVVAWQKKQAESFRGFGIEFDGGYGSTNTRENEKYAGEIFSSLKKNGYVIEKEIEQFFDTQLNRFLPDRMVRGSCPKCQAKDQYGDSCEVCGRTYHPTDLLNPTSALSGASPILKKSRHYFVSLGKFKDALQEWLNTSKVVHEDTKAYLDHWFSEGLKDWDITRDGPYFGFLIPGETNKYFYVWLDATIGYISLTDLAGKKLGRSVSDYWRNTDTNIIHFIGKDIVYFHTLFWPAMLMSADFTLPKEIIVHGMLTIDGEKMSKSRGTFILADTFKRHLNPEALRYYFACKLSKRIEDVDLNLSDFQSRVNSDLVNKVVNVISRALPLLHRFFDSRAYVFDPEGQFLVDKALAIIKKAEAFYLDNEPGRAILEIVRLAEEANKYLQDAAPWKLVTEDPKRAHKVLTTALYVGKVCFALLKPVLPHAVLSAEKLMNGGRPFTFDNIGDPFSPDTAFPPYEHLFKRIEDLEIENMIKETKESSATETTKPQGASAVDFDLFAQVELRSARVVNAKNVEGSDKLIECTLDVGALGVRTVFTGLRPHVDAEMMLGKTVILVANLLPRKMRFGVSEGMILAAGEDKPSPVFLNDIRPGERLR